MSITRFWFRFVLQLNWNNSKAIKIIAFRNPEQQHERILFIGPKPIGCTRIISIGKIEPDFISFASAEGPAHVLAMLHWFLSEGRKMPYFGAWEFELLTIEFPKTFRPTGMPTVGKRRITSIANIWLQIAHLSIATTKELRSDCMHGKAQSAQWFSHQS